MEISLDKCDYRYLNVPKVAKGDIIEFYEFRNHWTYEVVTIGQPYFESPFYSAGIKTVFLEIIVDDKEHFVTWDKDRNRWVSGYNSDYIPNDNSESIL